MRFETPFQLVLSSDVLHILVCFFIHFHINFSLRNISKTAALELEIPIGFQ